MIARLLMTVTMLMAAMGSPAALTDNVAAGNHYLYVDEEGFLSMWLESNQRPGLQTEPVVVMGEVRVWPDTRVHL